MLQFRCVYLLIYVFISHDLSRVAGTRRGRVAAVHLSAMHFAIKHCLPVQNTMRIVGCQVEAVFRQLSLAATSRFYRSVFFSWNITCYYLFNHLKPLYVGFQAKEGSINGTNQNDTIKEPSDSQNKQTQIGELEYVSDLSSEQTVFVQVRLHLNNLLIKTILRYSLFRNFKPNIFQLM